jgi:hypothetical protein
MQSPDQLESRLGSLEQKVDNLEKNVERLGSLLEKVLLNIRALKSQGRGFASGVPIDAVQGPRPIPPEMPKDCTVCNGTQYVFVEGSPAKCKCRIEWERQLEVHKIQEAAWVKKAASDKRRRETDERKLKKQPEGHPVKKSKHRPVY